MRRLFNTSNLMLFTFSTFVVSIIYVVARIILAPTVAPDADIAIRVKSDYVLMLLQSIFGVLAMLLPGLLLRRVRLNIPSGMLVCYAIFLYCAIYLGEVRDFYYRVPHWDTVLHTFSGAALGALGFSVINLLNRSNTITFKLSPIFVALFAFCFAISLGVLWEIYEFFMDSIFNTNMQKYGVAAGQHLVGQAALSDTMKDLIVDAIGAFIISASGYVSLKYDKKWLDRLHIKRT